MKRIISALILISAGSISLAQEGETVANAACFSHVTKDIPKEVGWYAECSEALQRASRKTLRKFCAGESLHNDPRVAELKLEAIGDFRYACRCEAICSQ